MHFKHRNEGLCSGSLSPAMCHFLNSPNLPDTSRKLSLRTQLLQLHMPVSHTMTNRTDLNTWGYNSNPDTNNTNCPGYHLTVHRILSLFILSRFYRNPPQSSELFPSVIHKGNKLTPKSQWFVQSSTLNIFAVQHLPRASQVAAYPKKEKRHQQGQTDSSTDGDLDAALKIRATASSIVD